jgi:hypothetical protein
MMTEGVGYRSLKKSKPDQKKDRATIDDYGLTFKKFLTHHRLERWIPK